MKRTLIFLALVLLAGCGGQTSTPPPSVPPPPVPETPYRPPDPVTEVPDSPYVGDWAWSTTRDGETLSAQGILSVYSFNSTGRGSGSWARCDATCPAAPEDAGSFSVSDSERFINFALYDKYQDEAGDTKTYTRFFGLGSGSGFQRDEQGRLFFKAPASLKSALGLA